MIRLDHLTKDFRGRRALDDLSLEIPAGEIFGLLGHNGAGKSTAFGLMLGQMRPTSGEAFIRGISIQRDRVRALQGVGAIYETPAFYEYLTGWDNLRALMAYSSPVPKVEIISVVGFVGLEERIHEKVRTYSHGMKQRLALAQALLPRPDIVLLDEPAEGLDPEGIHDMRRLILQLNREHGMTVLISSHLLAEMEQLCTRVAILQRGQMIFQGRWSDLSRKGTRFQLEIDDWDKGRVVLQKCDVTLHAHGVVELKSGDDIADVVAELVRSGVKIREVEPMRQTLEEFYLERVSAP